MSTSFQAAIQETSDILERLTSGQITTEQAMEPLKDLLANQESCRGFFVSFLTGDYKLADEPPAALIDSIQNSGKTPIILLVKNLVMSTNMSVAHERNGDVEKAEGSRKVARRASAIIGTIKNDLMTDYLRYMQCALTTALSARGTCGQSRTAKNDEADGAQPEVAEFRAFLDRWKYDSDQMMRSKEAIDRLLG